MKHLLLLAGLAVVSSQAGVLSLSSANPSAGSPVTLSLTLNSGTSPAPASLQWTMAFPAGMVSIASVKPGAAAQSAGKDVTCASQTSGSQTCVLYSMHANPIPNGVVALITLQSSAITDVGIVQTVAASTDGQLLALRGIGGSLTVTGSTLGPFQSIRVNSGGPDLTTSSGQFWKADYGFLSGSVNATQKPIAGTQNPVLFQTERLDSRFLEYRFAVPAGRYVVTLRFAELHFTSAGQRVFNGVINGLPVLQNFDIVKETGGPFIAIDEAFTIDATDSILIQLTPVVASPKINAIQIMKAP